jgi:hypothetical protein
LRVPILSSELTIDTLSVSATEDSITSLKNPLKSLKIVSTPQFFHKSSFI